MWQLTMKTPADQNWTPAATFPTVTEAARCIVHLEGIPKNGLFLEFYVETDEFGSDDEAFRVFHYTGQRALRHQAKPSKLKASRDMKPSAHSSEHGGRMRRDPAKAVQVLDTMAGIFRQRQEVDTRQAQR
jgi:hypothetical protein